MKKAGFKPHVAGAVEVAASTNGQLVPPVMGAAAFIMAEITDVPYSRIVIAAAIPALLSYIAIFTMIHLNALRTGIPASDPATLPPLVRTLLRGLPLNLPLLAVLVFLLALALSEAYAAALAIWVTLGVFAGVALVAPTSVYGLQQLAERRAAGESLPYSARLTLLGQQTLAAFRDGAMNMIGIACACACCGIIIAVVNQTGLGAKITAIIADLSAGHLLPALLLTAAASIMLGIGLPTTATYIIMATLTAPALLNIAAPAGASEITVSLLLAAHLFVFYYGILADDTPPVGLCAYAASGIAGADPIRTGLTSFRFDLAAFMLPLIFFYNRELLLIDVTWAQVAWVLPGAVVAMLAFAAALEGWAIGPLAWWMRALLVLTAFLLIQPAVGQSLAGAALLTLVLAAQHWRRQAPARHNTPP
jgi:TRAP transporter 4TM/12TM fusion protein